MSQAAVAPASQIAPLVLFDLDGTLADSAIDLAAAVNDVRAGLALAAVPVEQVRTAISAGALAILTLGLPELSEVERRAQVESFLAHYIER
ncbi:MAG: phosphoglycolate phosphatase, partial [Gammaproteobacteria bacterium]|nr:phosphoglycolate phosphatase [Gammaproteobacteria bacterium]